MKIKIVSDGTVRGTKVVNADTGDWIEGITAIEWRVEAGARTARANIEMMKIPVEMAATVDKATTKYFNGDNGDWN